MPKGSAEKSLQLLWQTELATPKVGAACSRICGNLELVTPFLALDSLGGTVSACTVGALAVKRPFYKEDKVSVMKHSDVAKQGWSMYFRRECAATSRSYYSRMHSSIADFLTF
ncbi:MAG: hypothetical protein LHW59_05870 [Candidatus Cloacimonetes bacterium]|nr:hypothetical protein [Candidatus Cloacimonadota bacterium]